MTDAIIKLYEEWLNNTRDEELLAELRRMATDERLIEDAFYRELSFGTAGLRGVLGAGTNRMNIYTVGRATAGLAAYLKKDAPGCRVAISYDSRLHSEDFARISASVLAEQGFEIYIYPQLMPVPCLSFAVRYLDCKAGIMVTASHNPSKYNGYKVYGEDGAQLGEAEADAVLAEINKLDYFGTAAGDFEALMAAGRIRYIGEAVYTAFIEAVKQQAQATKDELKTDVAIVYSPLNGSGLKPVTRVLAERGFTNITVVPEQEKPDGHFPTCPYPNPEIREAMALGVSYAEKLGADLLVATDPDCDRVGIAVRERKELVEAGAPSYRLLTGNMVGVLLTDYICARRIAHGTMPAAPILCKSVVSTALADKVAAGYGVSTKNVLTGFKFIGEQIALLERAHAEENFILGFEESYGYLAGTHARDKDGVVGTMMICEMFSFYAAQGITLLDRLDAIYARYGFCKNTGKSYEFAGAEGFAHMQELMTNIRAYQEDELCGYKLLEKKDYNLGLDGMPPANMVFFRLEGDRLVIIRPSGTEPKIKAYITVYAADEAAAGAETKEILAKLDKIIC